MNIELDRVEAHLILGPISEAQIAETLRAAHTSGPDAEAASIRASVLGRVANRIADELLPATLTDPVRRHILEQEVELGML